MFNYVLRSLATSSHIVCLPHVFKSLHSSAHSDSNTPCPDLTSNIIPLKMCVFIYSKKKKKSSTTTTVSRTQPPASVTHFHHLCAHITIRGVAVPPAVRQRSNTQTHTHTCKRTFSLQLLSITLLCFIQKRGV